jgi:hypothetical protein
MELPVVRTEFGFERSACGCERCAVFCRYMPGYLIPSDLERLIPPEADALAWAKVHLRAVMPGPGGMPNLVPAQKRNGHCHWYEEGKCLVWQNSPYGCAFFDQHMSFEEHDRRNQAGRAARQEAFEQNALYARLWQALKEAGLVRAGRGKELNQRLGSALQEIRRHEVVELLAYDCGASRRLYQQMRRVQQQYGEQLVVHCLPVPMCPRCNAQVEAADAGQHRGCELARLAWAIKLAEPARFDQMHAWLLETDDPPRLADARHYASTLVGPDALERALAGTQVEESLAKVVQLYAQARGGKLPKLIAGRIVLEGEPSGETLSHFLEQVVGINAEFASRARSGSDCPR